MKKYCLFLVFYEILCSECCFLSPLPQSETLCNQKAVSCVHRVEHLTQYRVPSCLSRHNPEPPQMGSECRLESTQYAASWNVCFPQAPFCPELSSNKLFHYSFKFSVYHLRLFWRKAFYKLILHCIVTASCIFSSNLSVRKYLAL